MTPYLKVSNLTQYEFLNNKSQLPTSISKSDLKHKEKFSTQKLAPQLKASEVHPKMKSGMSQFSDSGSNDLQGSLKNQVSFARSWIKRNIVPSRDTTLSFCVILIAYHHFCKENDQLPLNPNDLLQVLHSSLDCDMSSSLENQNLKTNEITQEYLSTLNGLKLEASSDDQAEQDDFRYLQNLKFKCDLIKIESDDAYESDLSDSDMKEISNDYSVLGSKSSDERDSSYESFDETSNEAISLLDVHEGENFATKPEIVANRTPPTKYSNSVKVSQVIDVSEALKVNHQNSEVFVTAKRQVDDDNDERHNKLFPAPKRVKWSEEQRKVMFNMKGLLEFHLENYKGSICYGHAKNLSETLLEMLQRKQLKFFLQEFGHAMSCGEEHGSLCFMFKRVVHHLLHSTHHDCALKNMYGHILRLHLDTCNEDRCGFPNCKLRREERQERLIKQQEMKKLPLSAKN